MWIDSHAHLGAEPFADDLDDVLARAVEAGVTEVVNIGTQLDDSRALVELAREVAGRAGAPRLWSTVGVHPSHADRWDDSSADALRALAAAPEVVGLGEIGLDFYWDSNPPEDVQRAVFAEQLALADELALPIVIHCRDALPQTLEVLDAHAARRGQAGGYRGVFHCFGGTAADVPGLLERGFHLSFTGPVTFKKAEATREAARAVPPERLLVETDCPYLAPVPRRGKRNEPAYVVHTARKLAELHGIAEADFAALTTATTRALFAKMQGA